MALPENSFLRIYTPPMESLKGFKWNGYQPGFPNTSRMRPVKEQKEL